MNTFHFSKFQLKEIQKLADYIAIRKLKNGHYSKVYFLKDEFGNTQKIRFFKENNTLQVVSSKKPLNINPNGKYILLNDKELGIKLPICKLEFEKQCKQEINYNISNEQKELLAQGKDITLEVNTQNTPTNNFKFKSLQIKDRSSKTINKTEFKNFVADLTFFLGKTSNLIHPTKTITHGLKLTNHN